MVFVDENDDDGEPELVIVTVAVVGKDSTNDECNGETMLGLLLLLDDDDDDDDDGL